MTRTARRLLFYGLLLIFVLITPPSILYAIGYSFDWKNLALVPTGGIYLKSIPSGAKIFIDGKAKKTTPRLISRILAHRCAVQVTKDGFHPWQKNLEVSPQLVTEARSIFLFPVSINPELIAQNTTSTIESYLRSEAEKQKQNQAQKIASSSASWLLKNNNIFYVSEINFVLYRTNLSESVREQISRGFLPPKNFYEIRTNNSRQFLVFSQGGELYYLDKNKGIFETLANQINGAQFSSDNKKILYFSDNEIWVYYLEDILVQPYKKAGEKELITRFAQKISQAIFYPDNEHIAFIVGEQIKITELDGRDQRNTADFISAPSPQIYFDANNDYLYYLSAERIFRIQLAS